LEEAAEVKRPNRFRSILYVGANIVGISLMLIGISLLFWIGRPYVTLYLSASTKRALEAKARGPVTAEKRIIIPAVLVDAPINEGFTNEALKTGIAHVSDSAIPGEPGTVVLAGHNYAYFVQGDQNFFSLLHLMKPGTPIYIFWAGKRYVYKSYEMETVPMDDPVIFAQSDSPSLTLVGCASSWDSATISATRRLVVRARPAAGKAGSSGKR